MTIPRLRRAWTCVALALFHFAAVEREVAVSQEPGDPGLEIEPATFTSASGTDVSGRVGRLAVPENRSDPETRSIRLAFVWLEATGEPSGPPVVYLAGGPGGSSTWMAREPRALESWLPLLATRELIFLDQRGTGESEPDLVWRSDLPLPANIFRDSATALEHVLEASRRAKAALLERGIDLGGYTTVESADDIDALREALGLERISLLGFSYGTHLALSTIRRHGGRVQDAVLVGVEGPDHTLKEPLRTDTQWAKIAEMARRDPGLGGIDLETLLDRVLARLDRAPMAIEIPHPATGEEVSLPVGSFGLRYVLRRDIGDASDLPVFPRLLHSIDRGDPSVLRWFVAKRFGEVAFGVNGMSWLVDGASGASPARRARIAQETSSSRFGGVVNFPFPQVSEVWEPPDLGPEHRGALASDVRTLFLSGTLDWNAPPYQAEEVRWGFPRSTHVIVGNAGHEQILPQPEIRAAIVRFLRGESVDDVTLTLPPLRFVPLEGRDPAVSHPSVEPAGG